MATRLPALSFKALKEVKDIEVYALSCAMTAAMSATGQGQVNRPAAIRDLRTCADAMFLIYVGDYGSIGMKVYDILREIEDEIVNCLSQLFRFVLDSAAMEAEIRGAIGLKLDMALEKAKTQIATERQVIVATEAVLTISAQEVLSDLCTQRAALLSDYKTATSASNRSIYTAKNSGIHKPEFYAWCKGTLPPDSATTIAFERFLREKKKPIQREKS